MTAAKLMFFSLLVSVLLLAGVCEGGYGKTCPGGWSYNKGSCYKTIATAKSLYNARIHCLSMDSDLAIINSPQENSFVARLAYAQTKAHHLWIGLHRYTDTKFYWSDGTPIAGRYTNWAPKEPSSVSEECGMMYSTPRHKYEQWNDSRCSTKLMSMCERAAE